MSVADLAKLYCAHVYAWERVWYSDPAYRLFKNNKQGVEETHKVCKKCGYRLVERRAILGAIGRAGDYFYVEAATP